MGKKPRLKQERLGEKLVQIRNSLGLSQTQIWKRLDIEDSIPQKQISKYELGITEPPLMVILQYAHVAGVHVEDIIDDELDLPQRLPGSVKYEGIKSKSAAQSKRASKKKAR
jgi:transcriptional regulator with XRE-family HTH domain